MIFENSLYVGFHVSFARRTGPRNGGQEMVRSELSNLCLFHGLVHGITVLEQQNLT